MKEKWVDIDFADGKYMISSKGRIVSYHGGYGLLSPGVVDGYYQITLMVEGKPKSFYVHKLTYLFFGNHKYVYYSKLSFVGHMDHDRLNNDILNLVPRYSYKEVAQHRILRKPFSEIKGKNRSKLTPQDREDIYFAYPKTPLYKLAAKYKTSDMSIHRAIKRYKKQLNDS